jgi:hypothetical protein
LNQQELAARTLPPRPDDENSQPNPTTSTPQHEMEHPMSSLITAAIGAASGLTDAERALLLADAVDAVAARDGLSREAAAELLDRATETGDARLVGDAERVTVTVYGEPVVVMTRAELRELAG